jgi:hypothetical protein
MKSKDEWKLGKNVFEKKKSMFTALEYKFPSL